MNRTLTIALAAVVLDAAGMGLVMPVLPALLRELAPTGPAVLHFGALLSLYALAQAVFSPVLGVLSDRFGRRPVLLASLAGAAADYLVMALTPTLWVFYLGRAVAGMTGATGAVAGACIADVSEGAARTRRFGLMGAFFGAGIVAGPVLGGLLGGLSPRAPFVAAAVLHGLGLVVAALLLPETRPAGHGGGAASGGLAFNPFAGLGGLGRGGLAGLGALILVFVVLQLAGQAPASLWTLFGQDRLHWDAAAVGRSLGLFGLLHLAVQGWAIGPAVRRLGERGALAVGMAADAAGFVLLAFIGDWRGMALVMPLLALGGLAQPPLQGLLSNAVADDRQGRLQGLLASLTSLAAVAGPLAFVALYAASSGGWNGWPWLAAAGLYLLGAPAFLWARRTAAAAR
ncbi:hypothetical protein C5708_09030 [Caulobacter sp. CCUG 60055]|uniref:TCR/Tet family MFS transporter n=1 Tax=Caulobacter sp. CCUG 60055 TaxID=2100090 RepID=UPI001FA6C0BA|nr:TCR/Tet family MFS transporter [Caulobacter sp. CCUG 60055]MBQ1542535.1 TCR/Tet family MFS transporter [Caulobacteraceae bacterium]MCI3180395.1 hypothetical protein [Caulobacter sp. CCUG 60055]